MSVYTTEIASDVLASDNPIHQRLLQAYYLGLDYVTGHLLEIGCGEGRGVELMAPKASAYTGIDKIDEVINNLKLKYPEADFRQMVIPPLFGLKDNMFDTVVSFQVIEHIRQDELYIKEIYRVLKPGGKALITTPNILMSLSRNPWHIREYTGDQLKQLGQKYFPKVTMMGISGNNKVMDYYSANKASVDKIMRWDILNLQYRLPAFLLKIPYELLNRLNRNKLQTGNNNLVHDISHSDYILTKDIAHCLDLFCIMEK